MINEKAHPFTPLFIVRNNTILLIPPIVFTTIALLFTKSKEQLIFYPRLRITITWFLKTADPRMRSERICRCIWLWGGIFITSVRHWCKIVLVIVSRSLGYKRTKIYFSVFKPDKFYNFTLGICSNLQRSFAIIFGNHFILIL